MRESHNFEPRILELQETKNYLRSFNFFRKYVLNEWEDAFYVDAHARRYIETLKLLPALQPTSRVLELGAIPYHMTILLTKHLNYKVDTINFYEVESAAVPRHRIESSLYQESYEFENRAVNVERDPFPFDDASFDAVLCCEILEHLLLNPSQMLYETHRVLRPGGFLLITTPNVLQWKNVFALLKGQNIYDHYRGNGMYGRHNREYSVEELKDLLIANNFAPEQIVTRNVYGAELINRVPFGFSNRRDNIFALARATDEARMAYPPRLFFSMEQHRNVVRPEITMGINETGQLGRGWHEFEQSSVGFRWTRQRAEFFLKKANAQLIKLNLCCSHPDAADSPVELNLTVNNCKLEKVCLADHNWHEAAFHLREPEKDSTLRCQLDVSRTWVPREQISSDDERDLGVAVNRAWAE
ncbi:MAG: methyltransferase domain-containing protein [Pyrinomonadaceae bacterium]|nr:methyltransferase domain-containing protein [Pyrinomonadaceae bacterium]